MGQTLKNLFFFLYDFDNFNKSWVEGAGYFIL